MKKYLFQAKNNAITRITLFIFLSLTIIALTLTGCSSFESTIPNKACIDFQNKSGVVRIMSSLTDLLISSEGSTKKGDGYILKLKIINPSSITLKNITCNFWTNGTTSPAVYSDVNTSIYPGSSKIIYCFFSGLSDYELKSVYVTVDFDQLSFYQE